MGSELKLRSIPNDYQYKSNYLKQNGFKIEILILGNSHTLNGINATKIPNAFCVAHSAQPFEYDWKILEKNYSSLPHLKTIILPISYFSYTINFKEGVLKNRVKDYRIYYGIDTKDYSLKNNLEIFHQSIELNFLKWKSFQTNPTNEIHVNEYGNPLKRKQFDLKKYNSSETVKKHTYPFEEKIIKENIFYLRQLLTFARENQIQVIFISTPTSPTYLANVDPNQLNHWRKTTHQLVKEFSNVKWYNFFEHPEYFNLNDFVDADHLNQLGADKLTEIIKSKIK